GEHLERVHEVESAIPERECAEVALHHFETAAAGPLQHAAREVRADRLRRHPRQPREDASRSAPRLQDALSFREAARDLDLEVVLAIEYVDPVLRVTGKVLPSLPGDPRGTLRVALDDAAAALGDSESFLAFAEMAIEDLVPPLEERRQAARVSSRVRVRLRF